MMIYCQRFGVITMDEKVVIRDYNGWTNRATWNIALWINNDEDWYALSRDAVDFADFRRLMFPITDTPDGAKFADGNIAELDEVIQENAQR